MRLFLIALLIAISYAQTACDWVAVDPDDCPTSYDALFLPECSVDMQDQELCEADSLLPNGNSNFDINNCFVWDVFRYECTSPAFTRGDVGYACRPANQRNGGYCALYSEEDAFTSADECLLKCEAWDDCVCGAAWSNTPEKYFCTLFTGSNSAPAAEICESKLHKSEPGTFQPYGELVCGSTHQFGDIPGFRLTESTLRTNFESAEGCVSAVSMSSLTNTFEIAIYVFALIGTIALALMVHQHCWKNILSAGALLLNSKRFLWRRYEAERSNLIKELAIGEV